MFNLVNQLILYELFLIYQQFPPAQSADTMPRIQTREACFCLNAALVGEAQQSPTYLLTPLGLSIDKF